VQARRLLHDVLAGQLNGGVPVTIDFPNRRAGLETMWR